jgi:type III secretory pathway component EscT
VRISSPSEIAIVIGSIQTWKVPSERRLHLFAASGGLSLLIGCLLQSYALWPLAAHGPALALRDTGLFEDQFSRMFSTGLGLAAPALVILTLAEFGMGLVGRFAPQLNVFSASLAVKTWLATFILLLCLQAFIQVLTTRAFGLSQEALAAIGGAVTRR